MTLYVCEATSEDLLAALTIGIPKERARAIQASLRAVREFRASDAGRIPTRDLRHVDLHGPMGNGAWEAQR